MITAAFMLNVYGSEFFESIAGAFFYRLKRNYIILD